MSLGNKNNTVLIPTRLKVLIEKDAGNLVVIWTFEAETGRLGQLQNLTKTNVPAGHSGALCSGPCPQLPPANEYYYLAEESRKLWRWLPIATFTVGWAE